MDDTRRIECRQRHPDASYAKCVKLQGHDDKHAAPLGVHPATEHVPEQMEWGYWPSTPVQPLPDTDEEQS